MKNFNSYINKSIQRIKLAQNRGLTNFGLRLFTHNRFEKNIKVKKNIAYGKNKLQKFDIVTQKKSDAIHPVIFYIHGGAWCGGDKYGYTMYCKKFANLGYTVVNINYRLMPKVDVKVCVLDCIKAINYFTKNYKSILQNAKISYDIDFSHCFMIGDSAGAHLCSLIAGMQTAQKIKLDINIVALGLYYGVYDFNDIQHDPSPVMTDLDGYWRSIYKSTKALYKRISPTTYITPNFPATFMTSGEIDKLHFQSEIFANALKQNGTKLDYLSFDKSRQDGRHAFLNAGFLPSAKEAFARVSEFFEEQLNNNNLIFNQNN